MVALFLAHVLELVLRGFALATVPHDGLDEIAGASVVQEVGMSVHLLLQADTPERRGTPFVASGQTADEVVVQAYAHDFRSHVVEQIVGVGVDGLLTEPGQIGAHQQGRASWLGMKGRDVA